MRRGCSSAAVFLLLTCALALAADTRTQPSLQPQSELEIFRSLVFEYATLREPLPSVVKEEQAVEIDATGKVNEEQLRRQLANHGMAVGPGEIVQITDVRIGPKSILLEINHGGAKKKKKKWYQRIQITAGPVGGPVGTPPPSQSPPPDTQQPGSGRQPVQLGPGSWVVLNFPQGVPDMTPEQVKQLLSAVFDFNQRTAVVPWVETLPEEFRDAIKQKRAVVGMDRDMVLAALGRPLRKVRETREGRQTEDWIYGNPPDVTFVTFVGDTVAEVREFH